MSKFRGILFLVAFVVSSVVGTLKHSIAAEIEVIDGGSLGQSMIVVSGEIYAGDDYRFYEISRQIEKAVVLLQSPGGEVDAGLSIAAEIAIRRFSTLVIDGDGCHSICAVIWVSGKRRYMTPDASISVHAAYRLADGTNGVGGAIESGVANATIGAYLNELGLSRQAIEYFTVARPDEPLLPITPDIAQMLDIDIYLQDDGQVITPSERPTPRLMTRQVAEYAGLATHCGRLFGVEREFWEAQARTVLKKGHHLFGSETFAPLLPEYTSAINMELDRDGFVRWCILAENSLRSDGLTTGITGPSFDCSRAVSRTEYAICGSEDLWPLDRAMSNLYFLLKQSRNSARSTEFLESQRQWLERRDTCDANVSCLIERYLSRLLDFGA